MKKQKSISVRRSVYDQLQAYAREHNVTMASIVELATAKDLVEIPSQCIHGMTTGTCGACVVAP